MSEIRKISATAEAFLGPFLPPGTTNATAKKGDLPFVTLTYAQSLDGMIASAPGARTTLSGLESKSMTHYLRKKHDAILVGAATARTDNPSLNCRYPGVQLNDQPHPVVIDARLAWDPTGSKVLELATTGTARAPWVVTTLNRHSEEILDQRRAGNPNGKLLFVPEQLEKSPPHPHGGLSWFDILLQLKKAGIGSVMIEGGAMVINALMQEPYLIDSTIVTIAPVYLGKDGVHVSPGFASGEPGSGHAEPVHIKDVSYHQFGNDMVLCGKITQRDST